MAEPSYAVSELLAERDRLRAIVDATLVWLHDMTEVARDQGDHTVADVTARQYRTIVAQLDVSPDGGGRRSVADIAEALGWPKAPGWQADYRR